MPNYVYHLTTKATALLIKANGMTSTFSRTGEENAHSEGAFAKDRDAKTPAKIESYVSEALGFLLNAGVTLDELCRETGSVELLPAPKATGNVEKHAEDSNAIRDWFKNEVDRYRKKFFPHAVELSRQPANVGSEYAKMKLTDRAKYRKTEGPKFMRSHPNHFICTLAQAQTELYYGVEEALTVRGIYFTKAQYAEIGYTEYSKHLGNEEIVILRVAKEKLTNPHDDPSEFKALRSEGKVEVGDIQVLIDHRRFLEKVGQGPTQTNFRDVDSSWIGLGAWNPKT